MAKRRKVKKSFKLTICAILVFGLAVGAMITLNNLNKPAKKIEYGKVTEFDANADYGKIKDPDSSENITSGAKLKYYVFDLGKGYGIFIDCGDTEVLIDAGYKKDGSKIAKKIKPYVKEELDYVISTNTNSNRIGGLPEILKQFRVQNVIYSAKDNTKGSSDLKKAAEKTNYIKGEDKLITLGENANLSIIAPDPKAVTPSEKSLSTIFTYGETKISETGDLPEKFANHLSDELSESNVIIAANNGEFSSNKLIELITPTYYVIPTNNKLSKKMTEWAEEYARNVYTTKKNKDVVFWTNGSEISSNHDET